MQATVYEETIPRSRGSVFVLLLSILFLALVAVSLGNVVTGRNHGSTVPVPAQQEGYPAFDGDATALPGIDAAYLTGQ